MNEKDMLVDLSKTFNELRLKAVKNWRDNFVAISLSAAEKALAVICMDEKISNWLILNDPMALKQCQKALSDNSWEDYLMKNP